MRLLIPTIPLAGYLLLALLSAPAHAAPAVATYATAAPGPATATGPTATRVASRGTAATLVPVATTRYSVTAVAAASETTIWLAGIDANHRVVVQRATKPQRADGRLTLQAPVTLRATAARGVQVSAVDDAEAWLVTAPTPEKARADGSTPAQDGTELWRYDGRRWARIDTALPDGTTRSAWEVRDLPGRRTALLNTGDGVWRYQDGRFVDVATDIYQDPAWERHTDFSYGVRPRGTDFLAIGQTPLSVNYLRGHRGTVSLISSIGGWALGSASLPTAWSVLPDGSTVILGHSDSEDETGAARRTPYCRLWSPRDTATSCPAPQGTVADVAVLGDRSLLLSAGGRLWRRTNATAADAAVTGDTGRGIAALDAARGSRVAWIATAAASGVGSTLSRYVAR